MQELLENAAFRTYALCSAILTLKMIASAWHTGYIRQRASSYINEEDARTFGGSGVKASAGVAESAATAHALRIQRNDLENIPAFFAIGFLYVLTGATPFGAAVYMWTFTLARLMHTAFYMNHLQPWRAIAYGTGALATIGMCVRVIATSL